MGGIAVLCVPSQTLKDRSEIVSEPLNGSLRCDHRQRGRFVARIGAGYRVSG